MRRSEVKHIQETVWESGKFQDKQIVIGVRELAFFGGRLHARGAVVTGPKRKIKTGAPNPQSSRN